MSRKFVSFLAVIVPFLFTGSVDAGWNSNALKNLDVNIEYSGYAYRDSAGDPVYAMGQTVRYRVTIYNNGNRPFKNYPIAAHMSWSGAVTCIKPSDGKVVSFGPLQDLIGSQSGPHLLTIDSDSYSFFDALYLVPNDVCPNSVQIKLDAGKSGNHDSLIIPHQFKIVQ